MNDSIKKMLRITEKDLMITEVSYETLQKKKTLVVDAVLSPAPRACTSCGSTVVDGNGKPKYKENDPRLQLAFKLFIEGNTDKEVEQQTGINRRTFRRYRMKYGVNNESRRKKMNNGESNV